MTSGSLKGSPQEFTFDCRNRLTAVGATSYSYDAENNRIGVSVNSQTTSYVVNPNAGLSQVLVKTDPDGTRTCYVYGLGLIGEEINGNYRNYHFDLRGSTVALSSSNGTILERFQYGPYGEIQWVTGFSSIPFLYNGRDGVITDANGLYYMRARYYNLEIMRFMSRDEIIGNVLDPMSLNRYAYVKGNPVSGVDPTGQTTIYDLAAEFDAQFGYHVDYSSYSYSSTTETWDSGYIPSGFGPTVTTFDYSNIESVRANPKPTFSNPQINSSIGYTELDANLTIVGKRCGYTKGTSYSGDLFTAQVVGETGIGKSEADFGRAQLEVKGPSAQGSAGLSISTNPEASLYGKASLAEMTGKTSIGPLKIEVTADFVSAGGGVIVNMKEHRVKGGIHLGMGVDINVGW